MVPVTAHAATSSKPSSGLIAEVDFDTFSSILQRQSAKPLVLARTSKFSGYTYVTQYAGCWFALKLKKEYDFSRQAELIPIKRFFQSFGQYTL
jgi:hypothetical protein